MNLISKSAITVFFGLSISHSMSALESFQQKQEEVQLQNDVKADTTQALKKHLKPNKRSDAVSTNFNTVLKITDNSILNRSYNRENASFGIDNYYILNLGFDASTKIFKTDDLKFKLNSFIEQSSDSGIQSSFISVDWARPKQTKIGYSFSLAHTGKSYSPTLEFIMRKGVLALSKKLTYEWIANETSHIKRHALHLTNSAVWNYSGSLIENNLFIVDWVLETKSTNVIKLSLLSEYNNVGGAFQILRDIEVLSGKYANKGITLRYEMRKSNHVKTNIELTARELYNAKGYSFSIDPSWNIAQHFSLNTGLNIHHYRFDSDETLRLVLPFVKSSYMLSPKLSIDLFSQYSTETKRIALNSNIKFALKGGIV